MTIGDIAQVLDARVHTPGPGADTLIPHACGADLMSDVMAFSGECTALLTGLVTPATVRTAELLDIPLVIFVRGKVPQEEMREPALQAGICLMSTDLTLFEACGRLYEKGVRTGTCGCRSGSASHPARSS